MTGHNPHKENILPSFSAAVVKVCSIKMPPLCFPLLAKIPIEYTLLGSNSPTCTVSVSFSILAIFLKSLFDLTGPSALKTSKLE